MRRKPQSAPLTGSRNPYNSLRYSNKKRIFSYAHQLSCVIDEGGQDILEIGPGPGIVTAMLRHLNFNVTTVDVNPEVNADVESDIMNMPFEEKSFDTVLCCQVLEHLPFRDFAKAVRLIKRVSRRSAIISLPDATRHIDLFLNLPKIGNVSRSFHYSPGRKNTGAYMKELGHYWEIGYDGIDINTVTRRMEHGGWRLIKTWRVNELPWHRFCVLRRESGDNVRSLNRSEFKKD